MKILISENTLKNLPFEKYWDIQVKKGMEPSVDDDFEMVFGIRLFDEPEEIYTRLINYIGGPEVAINKTKQLLEDLKPYEYNDGEHELRVTFLEIVNIEEEDDDLITIDVDVDVDGKYIPEDIPIDEYYDSPGDWFDFREDVSSVMDDYYYDNITKKTGIKIYVVNVT